MSSRAYRHGMPSPAHSAPTIACDRTCARSHDADGEMQFIVRDLGRMRYDEALALQRECVKNVIAGREADSGNQRMFLLLVEHDPPVITISRRPDARQHLIAGESQLRAAGVEIAETDRGGDITYHGPGQLVVYPILDLNALGLRLHSYMRLLEQIVIDVLNQFGIEGERDAGATGVWVCNRILDAFGGRGDQCVDVKHHDGDAAAPPPSKICAMGVRITRWVSMHGLALNVTTNLDHFNLIIPCGLAGRSVTSLQRELGASCPSMSAVKSAMVQRVVEAAKLPRAPI
jgi:lipoyl(octanoyl) transferase